MTKGNILVTDDEPEVLELCLRVLKREGYEVWGANLGCEAISLGQRHKFDLLLIDIHMPDITGLEVAQSLRQAQPDITCVTMTGYGTMELVIDALKLGIDEFIVKPFGPNELIVSVSKALEKKELQRESARLHALIPLFELNKTLLTTVDMNDLLEQAARIAWQETKADRASLFLLRRDSRDDRLFHKQVSYPDRSIPIDERHLETVAAQYVVQYQRPLSLPADHDKLGETWKAPVEHALRATPLLVKHRPIGALIVAKEGFERPFLPSDDELLSVLGGQVAIAIENAHLFEEIQRAYEELKELDRLKSEFINIAAHELRTPLAIILGYVGILQEELDDRLQEYVQPIVSNGRRLTDTIDGLLQLRNLETGQMRVNVEVFSVRDSVTAVVEELRPLADNKKHVVSVDVPEDLPSISTDRRKFELILLNLLSNAIKFTPPGGQIQIVARCKNGAFEVQVVDNGVGIAAEDHEKIFSQFYQTEHSLTREHGGMGLGLAITKGLVELLGGEIKVESDKGKGSKFTFIIPSILITKSIFTAIS